MRLEWNFEIVPAGVSVLLGASALIRIGDEMKRLIVRRMELLRQLSSQRELDKNLPIQ